jgi:hypothetical protein
VSAYGAAAVSTATVTPETAPLIVTYDVVDAAGNAARTRRRRVYVVDRCGLGERMCEGDTCSQQGVCLTMQLVEPEPVVNIPPQLQLVGSATVQVGERAASTVGASCERKCCSTSHRTRAAVPCTNLVSE